jgi:hypothetical protein
MVSQNEQQPRKLPVTRIEEDEPSGKQLISEIRKDVRSLNESSVGGKGDWKQDGCFVLVGITNNVYVYHHPSHAACSSVKFSQIELSEFNISPIEHKLLAKENLEDCQHKNHYRLEPFFMDNCRLSQYYTILQQSNDDEVTEVLSELTEVERRIERGEMVTDSEFIRPGGLSNNWDENDWTKRLHVGIKKTFKVDVTCGAGIPNTEFKQILMCLNVAFVDQQCFIFRGLPDIIIHRKCVVIGTSASINVSDSSGDEESVVENSWQRTTLKGSDIDSPSAKLGEVVAGLHILLIAKILRKIKKKKKFCRKFQVKGLLLDRAAVTVECSLSVDLSSSGARLNIKLIDYMGMYDSKSLCYLIRAITCKDN